MELARRQRHNGTSVGLTELGGAQVLCVACVARRWSLAVAWKVARQHCHQQPALAQQPD